MAADSHWFTLQPSVARATLLGDSTGTDPSGLRFSRVLLIILAVPACLGDVPIDA
jgi:hypothetical protein